MSDSIRLTRQDLEDGTLLKAAVHTLQQEQTKEHFLNVLALLRDSYVWIPCSVVLGEKDQALLEKLVKESSDDPKALTGAEFTSTESIRMIPDILQSGEQFFFPIFSNPEEMGEYGDHFSKIEKHFLEALTLAQNNEKSVAGIVLNAFTEPFCLNAELFDVFENTRSNLDE